MPLRIYIGAEKVGGGLLAMAAAFAVSASLLDCDKFNVG
jgi:hypothetical protein